MFRPLELFIGLRYTRAKRRNHFISFISLTSMLGIALGITALITVLSVMNGFQQELRGRILAMTAHATISRWNGLINDWPTVREQARRNPEVQGGAPYIRGEAMLNNVSLVSGALTGQRRADSGHFAGGGATGLGHWRQDDSGIAG